MFQKELKYTASWIYTTLIGLIVGGVIAFIIIFLQPLDTYQHETPYKNLKLAVYGLAMLLSCLLIHLLEEIIYKKQGRKWYLWNEIVAICLGMIVMIIGSYLHNVFVINDLKPNFLGLIDYGIYIASPYIPLLVPLWAFLRWQFGSFYKEEGEVQKLEPVLISGANKSDIITLNPFDFIYAQAQQNYVEIFYRSEGEKKIEKRLIRTTLSKLNEQMPLAQQVHRSYLVNPDCVLKIEGNARKRFLSLREVEEAIPVSAKFYEALQNKLSDSSQKNQKQP